jgi:uncharacterized protein (TIGR02302 family)
MARLDPRALRVALALVLLVAWVQAGGQAGGRLLTALSPSAASRAGAVAVTVDLWITPPAYTGLPPIYLDAAHHDPAASVAVPVGSIVLARVHGAEEAPDLVLDDATQAFTALDAGDFSATREIVAGSTLGVRVDGTMIAHYALSVVRDKPPTIRFARMPYGTAQKALAVAYLAEDDYGVTDARLEIRPIDAKGAPLTIDFPTPLPAQKRVAGTGFRDLTASPWAGSPVELRLVAEDAAKQTGISAPLRIILPARDFHHPVARAVIAQRRILAQAADRANEVADTLDDLSSRPGAYANDEIAFLALRVAVHALATDGVDAAGPQMQDLLWQVALRIEYGGIVESESALRNAENALQDALARRASGAELEKLIAGLRQSIAQYLRDLVRNELQNGGSVVSSGPARVVSAEDIQNMLDRATELARSGSPDAARQALADLQSLLESLRSSSRRAGGPNQDLMRGLDQAEQHQQQLMDQSFQHGQAQGDRAAARAARRQLVDEAGAQDALRRSLDGMTKAVGQGNGAADAFARAQRAMSDASGQLRQGDADGAVRAQGEALDALREAGREIARQAAQSRDAGGDAGGEDGGQADGRDPFGRTTSNGSGADNQDDVALPANADIHRSRAILDELRRRQGDLDRPQPERDYIDRLLESF